MKAAVALLVVVAALALVAAGFYLLHGGGPAERRGSVGAVRPADGLITIPTFKANAHMLRGKQRHAGELMALNVFGDWSMNVDFVRWDPRARGPVYYGAGNTTPSWSWDTTSTIWARNTNWIVKNSWGTQWGDHGYININAAANNGRVAGILTHPIYVE